MGLFRLLPTSLRIPTINDWTKEQMIATVIERMPGEGKCVVNPDDGYADGRCVYYRESDGKSCAAGAFIPLDTAKSLQHVAQNFSESFVSAYCRGTKFPLDLDGMQRMQHVHDRWDSLSPYPSPMVAVIAWINATVA